MHLAQLSWWFKQKPNMAAQQELNHSFHWLFFTSPSFFLHDFLKLSLTHSRSFCRQQPPPVFGPWLMFHPHHCCTSVEAEGPVSSYYDSGKENKVSLSWQRPVRACRHLSPAQSWSWENRYAGRRRRRAERGEKKFLEMFRSEQDLFGFPDDISAPQNILLIN